MMWNNDGWCGGAWGAGGWLMLIGIVLLAVAATLLVVYALRGTSRASVAGAGPAQGWAEAPRATPAAGPAAETAREIVQRRYAAGEIDRDEYLQKLQDL